MRFSAVVAVRDEEEMLEGALRLLGFCDEIVVVIDDRTVDRTEEIARRFTDKVFRVTFTDFSTLKNAGVEEAQGDWIVFCDADERVTPRLAADLQAATAGPTDYVAFANPTVKFFLGSADAVRRLARIARPARSSRMRSLRRRRSRGPANTSGARRLA